MKHDDWTRQLRDRLADHRTAAPDGLWDKIETQLDKQRYRKRRRTVLYAASWLSAAAVALLLVGVLHTDEAAFPPPCRSAVVSARHGAAASEGSALAAEASTGSVAMASAGRSGGGGLPTDACTDAGRTDSVMLPASADKAEEAAVASHDTRSRHGDSAVGSTVKPVEAPHDAMAWENYAHDSAGKRRSAWSVNAYAGNIMARNQSMTAGLPALACKSSSPAASAGQPLDNAPVLFANYKETKHHSQPVSFGVSVSYALGSRLSLRSGLAYTRVTSDFIHSLGSEETADRQTLHYIGVPIALSCRVWGSRFIHTYATLGAQLDFNVKATLSTVYGDTPTDKDRPQFSGNAAIGVECDILPQVGVYAEPGVRYYFNNNSSVENVFKAQPWAFNVQVGVRINVK